MYIIYIYICTYIYIYTSVYHLLPIAGWFNDNQPMLLFNGGFLYSQWWPVSERHPKGWAKIPHEFPTHWTTIVDHYGVVLCLFRWKHAGTAQLKKKHTGPKTGS